MTVKVSTWVWEHSPTTGNDRIVMLALADEADDDGTNCHPSQDRLEAKTRIPKRTVQRCLDRLAENGEIIIDRPEQNGRGFFNAYVLIMGRDVDELPPARPWEEGRQSDTLPRSTRRSTRNTKGNEERRVTARNGAPMGAPDPQTLRDGDLTITEEPSSDVGESDDDVRRLCWLLADLVAKDGSKRPPITRAWLTECDRLIRLDGHTAEQVEKAIRWCQADQFWRANILSMPTLRKQYDRLRKAAMRDQHRPAAGPRYVADPSARDLPEGRIIL